MLHWKCVLVSFKSAFKWTGVMTMSWVLSTESMCVFFNVKSGSDTLIFPKIITGRISPWRVALECTAPLGRVQRWVKRQKQDWSHVGKMIGFKLVWTKAEIPELEEALYRKFSGCPAFLPVGLQKMLLASFSAGCLVKQNGETFSETYEEWLSLCYMMESVSLVPLYFPLLCCSVCRKAN